MHADLITRDFAALCHAVDGGDDSALPILADWLEEAGDARAAGLRRVIVYGLRPQSTPGGVQWLAVEWCVGSTWRKTGRPKGGPNVLMRDARSLAGFASQVAGDGYIHTRFATRAVAYLALAAALTEGTPYAAR